MNISIKSGEHRRKIIMKTSAFIIFSSLCFTFHFYILSERIFSSFLNFHLQPSLCRS